MNTTKSQRKAAQLENHYKALEYLGAANGKKASNILRRLEMASNRICTAYCNGEHDETLINVDKNYVTARVAAILPNLEGFYYNTDPRGYTLKIDESVMREKYAELRLQKDWGGYGLLAPEITGN